MKNLLAQSQRNEDVKGIVVDKVDGDDSDDIEMFAPPVNDFYNRTR